MARQGRMLDVSKEQLFLALASEVPQDGKVVTNPYTRWSEIDSSLPDIEIQVFGPPPTSGTRDAFVELVMHEGCASFDEIKALDEARREDVCSRMRQDGPFIEAGENDNPTRTPQKAHPAAHRLLAHSLLHK